MKSLAAIALITASAIALLHGCSVEVETLAGDAGRDATPYDSGEDPEPEPEPGGGGEDGPRPEVDSGKDANTPDADAGPKTVERKRVFVTKTRYNGDLKTAGAGTDGLDGADKLCAAAAANGGLDGKWRAWLSTNTVNAVDRIADVAPWYLIDKTTLVFSTKAQLSTTPAHAINVNETGTISSVGTLNRAWTGTKAGGTKATGNQCGDWTQSATGSATTGLYTAKDASWTRYVNDPTDGCDKTSAIYCFEQ